MGIGRNQVTKIAGATTFASLTDVDVTGAPQGSVLYYNGSKWVDLSYGTVDQVLTTNGVGANPSWTNKTSATGIVGGTDRMVQFNDGGSAFGGQAEFEFQKLTNNLLISGSSGYSFTAAASSSTQVSSGINVLDYDGVQSLQVGYNNLTNESYIWATQTGNDIKFGTEGVKRMEIASGGSVYTSGDLHASGTLSAVTNNLVATATLWTQKGDLVVGTGSDTAQRLASAAGDNGQVLTIDTGETTGLKWADPGGVEVIARYHVPVASASTGITGSRYVSSPIRIDPVGGDWEDGNVVITDDPGIGTVSTTGLGKLSLISQTGTSMLGVAASGAATTIAKFGSITNHTSTIQFLHNGYSDADILSKIVMTSGTTTIGATGSHKFILTGGLGITAQSSKPSDSVTNPALWVSGTSNLLYLSDVGMVTANSSTLTAGYVPYVSGAAKNGVGNSVLYNDATNSRIGINTASPNRDLDVRGTTLLSGAVGVTGTAEVSSTLTVKSDIIGTGTATLSTGALDNIKLDPSTGTAYIKLQDTSRTATTAGKQPELLLLQNQIDTSTHKANFPTIRWQKAGPVDALSAYTNLGYRMYVSGETGFGTVSAPQSMVWDYNADVADPANYQELMSLSSAGALTINRAYTLPTAAAGSNGYVITGNTNGTTGWAAQSGGGGVGGYWGLNGSKIHYTNGNVGIGTTDPDALLTVRGTSDLPIMILSGSGDTTYHYKTTGSGDISFQYHVNQGRSADIALISNADGAEKTTIRQKVVDANNSEMLFRTRDAGTLTNTMILSGSKVGMGTITPDYPLDIEFSGHSGIRALSTSGDSRLYLTAAGAGNASNVFFGDAADAGAGYVGYDHNNQRMQFGVEGSTRGAWNVNGLGIGTTNALNALHVLSTTTPQVRVAYDGSNYMNFTTDSSGVLTISGATTVTYPPFQVLPGGGVRIDRYTKLSRDTSSNGLNVDDGAGNAVPINVKGVMAGNGYFADPDTGEIQMYSYDNSDGDSTGKVTFNSRDSGGSYEQYAFISGTIHDATATEEAGQLDIGTLVDGTSTPTMTIVSGNVGIGTTTPDKPFVVRTGGTRDFKFYDYDMTYESSLGIRAKNGGYLALVTEGANEVFLSTNGFANKRLRVTSGGDVTIGGSAAAIASGKLTVEDTSNPQLTLAYDGTYHTTLKTDSAGDFHVNLTSGGTFNFGQSLGNEDFKFLRGNGDGVMSLRDNGNTYFNGQNVVFETTSQNYFQIKGTNTLGFGSGADFSMSASGNVFYMTSGTSHPSNAPILGITQAGNVGIATDAPGSRLHISGNTDYNNTGGIRLGTTSTYASIYMNNSSGGLEIDSPHSMILDCGRHMEFHAGGTTREHRFMYGTTQYGFMTTADANTYWAIGNKSIASAGLLLSGAAGGIRMVPADGNVTVVGTISATAKSFDIPHPDKEGKRLIHGSLEGPEHGVYVRGTAKGYDETTIELPDYWKTLVGDDYTLQLTSYNSSNIYIVEKGPKSFTVGSNALTYSFDYFAVGMREKIEVEIDGN